MKSKEQKYQEAVQRNLRLLVSRREKYLQLMQQGGIRLVKQVLGIRQTDTRFDVEIYTKLEP